MNTGNHIAQLVNSISNRLGDTVEQQVLDFATLFWKNATAEDLAARSVEDDAAFCIHSFRAFDKRQADEVVIRVENPIGSRDGWQSKHTLVVVIAPNMPFAVDSVLMALSQGGGTVTHFLNNVVFAVERKGDNSINTLTVDKTQTNRELFIYAEIDRISDEQLPELESQLRTTFIDLAAVVSDFDAMKASLVSIRDEIENHPSYPKEQVTEAANFLNWLLNDHFTFLGFRKFDYLDDKVVQVGTPLGVFRNRDFASVRTISEQPQSTRDFLLEPEILSFSKGGRKSRVHRPAYPDYVGIKHFDDSGTVIGEYGFHGLYTSPVYSDHPSTIPVVKQKLDYVVEQADFDPSGFDGKVLKQVLATYPRDELFQISQQELLTQAVDITNFHERRLTKILMREDRYGLFVSCMLYFPKDIFNTGVRKALENLLVTTVDAIDTQYDIYLSESILVRLQFVLRVNPNVERNIDFAALEHHVAAIVNDWRSEFQLGLAEEFGEVQGRHLMQEYIQAFSAGYRERYPASVAVADIACAQLANELRPISTRLYRLVEDDINIVRLKIFHQGEPLPLSDQIPKLEHMGFKVNSEQSFSVRPETLTDFWIHDFTLSFPLELDIAAVSELFSDSFQAIWLGDAENDGFNRLILTANMSWRQVSVLRSYARYLKQMRFGFSQAFIQDTLYKHQGIASQLIHFFLQYMDPTPGDHNLDSAEESIRQSLDAVTLLNEDKVLRQMFLLIKATLRTNYFQVDAQGKPKDYLSFKFQSSEIPNLPKPLPKFEIFVSAPFFEGVHLRAGAIARGGLRWSDRHEDYRTEVLGLMKAQVVKNGVIVPTGAKGGFVIKRHNEQMPEVVDCYKSFISGLLDLTDNRVGDQIVPPAATRCHDPQDPYLVVAADKGTATFSDYANEVATRYDFWLGDAFASGGSNGYDHKKMGITARGAWVSVQRHFSEIGINVQVDPVTVVAIGDMAGDVFGNGMLRSQSICLVAAFNHKHIFVDPTPDAATSYVERQRLFDLPRSSWEDYDTTLISQGGGIFSRDLKSLSITPQMANTFGIEARELSPDEFIHELLKAQFDLLWNGGIGTYVKASQESHDEVGDRANDHIRVDANKLKARVVGEGGNLGLTQLARIEYANCGGAINTDSIDNSAGVNCSDKEVNVKILLNTIVESGDLTLKQRNNLLESLTDEVASLVLSDNQSQTLAISLAQIPLPGRETEYMRFMAHMEEVAGLDRKIEAVPYNDELQARVNAGEGITRAELSVLLAYAKIHIKNALVSSAIVEEPIAQQAALGAFPRQLQKEYPTHIYSHSLCREIIASELANKIVDEMGIPFMTQLMEFNGSSVESVTRAYLAVTHLFGIQSWIEEIDTLANTKPEIQHNMLLELMELGQQATRWMIQHQSAIDNLSSYIEARTHEVQLLVNSRQDAMINNHLRDWQSTVENLTANEVSLELAQRTAAASRLADILPILEIAETTGAAPMDVALAYVHLSENMQFDALVEAIDIAPTTNHWQMMEKMSLIDSVKTLQGKLVADTTSTENTAAWLQNNSPALERWNEITAMALASPHQDLSMYAIICRRLQDSVAEIGVR